MQSMPVPHGKMRPSVPRAAFSHSASVGSRLPFQVQNWLACIQVTHTTGRFGYMLGAQAQGTAQTPAVTHCAYSDCVTSVRSMKKDDSITMCWGLSSGPHSASCAAQPIRNGPAGTWIISGVLAQGPPLPPEPPAPPAPPPPEPPEPPPLPPPWYWLDRPSKSIQPAAS